MGFDFTGHVLRAPQVAPTNAAVSSPPDNGVVRDVRVPPNRTAAQPDIVDLAGDQYRCSVLEAPGTSPVEYLVWAANSSQLALVDDPTWWTNDGSGRIPVGNLTVENLEDPLKPFSDGASRIVVTDGGGRSIGTILALVIARGDKDYDDEGWVDQENPALGRVGSPAYEVVIPTAAEQDGDAGLVRLSNLVPFGGGVSLARGDAVIEVRYTVAPAKFWWTRNDRYETRFGWDGKLQRWKAWAGSSPVNLGQLLFDETYQLAPKPRLLPVGSFLPGDAASGDQYATIRLGASPGVQSQPAGVNDPDGFIGIQVVPNEEVASAYDFSQNPLLTGVLGQTSGVLQFNPAFVEKHAGKTVWYVYQGFQSDSTGIVGKILGADTTPLFLAPVPGPTDRPLLRLGSRRHLSVTVTDSEADLEAAAEPGEGEALVALTTGRVRLSQTDIDKADPEKTATFNKHFLGEVLVYDGVALNGIAQPTKAPVKIIQSNGSADIDPVAPMYVLPSALWPEDVEGTPNESYMGLGVSGVLHLPDGTGAVPDPEGVNPALVAVPVRPGGDSLPPPGGGPAPQSLGLVRRVADGVSDLILFSRAGAVSELVVVDYNDELPQFPFSVAGGKAYIAQEATTTGVVVAGSRVQISSADRTRFADQDVYFLQAALTPATYTTQARVYSKGRIIFRFDGDEVLYFAIDGTAHDWHANTLPAQDFYTPDEVAASIQARITAQGGTGVAQAVSGRVMLASSTPATGVVEIGWGDPRDLSGAAALGFLPGWRVKGGKPNWLVDSGVSMGLKRSLINLDRSKPDSDYRARDRVEDVVLQQSVQPVPFVFFDRPPLQDVPGFDEGIFFNLQSVAIQGDDVQVIDKRLEHFADIQHRFGEAKFAWLGAATTVQTLQMATSTLALGKPNVVPESLLGAPGIGGGLYAAPMGGIFVVQKSGRDFVLQQEGLTGAAQLVTRYGARATFGAQGAFQEGGATFTDLAATFLADSDEPDLDENGVQKTDLLGNLLWLPLVRPGFRLKVSSGDAQGSYLVTAVTDGQHLEVTPPFVASSGRPTPWEVFKGIEDSKYDPALVADVVYKPFNHLPEETFRVRVLSPLGTIAAGFTARAHMGDALTSGRPISLRFGAVAPASDTTASLTALALVKLGPVANNQLVVPASAHRTAARFSIRVGTTLFTHGTDLVPVVAFSVDPGATVEYLTADWVDGTGTLHPNGELKFGSQVVSDLGSADVWVAEEFLDGADIPSGQAEYDAKTGDIRLSAADEATHADKPLYFVEQMITEDQLDVAVSPTAGAVSFRKPVRQGQLVEMEYWTANVEGRRQGGPDDRTVEFLPVFVRREKATRLSPTEYTLNVGGTHVVDTRIEPIVHIGPMQQNFGRDDFKVDYPAFLNGAIRLTFDRSLADHIEVVGTYAVFDALGGELAYSASQRPIYRPPFFIQASKDNFGLRGNRVGDFEPGQMMRVGAECFYITELRYFPDSDVTRVDIFPPTVQEVGSRSPGNDVLALVTAVPITTVLDPDGAAVPTTARAGFMQEIPLDSFPFEAVSRGQNVITFLGNLTTFAVPGHIMEIGGMPFTITQAELNEDGTRTRITFTAPFKVAIDPDTQPTVKLSYRPVYPPEVREFLGVGAVLDDEGVELVIFGETEDGVEQPGRTLARGTEFDLDAESGIVKLLAPLQAPLGPGQRLLLAFTQKRVMGPFLSGGAVVLPRFAATYLFNDIPSEDNGLVGGTLTATYTFDNPDAFYFRAVTLRSFLGEAVKEAIKEMKATTPNSGPIFTASGGTKNWENGRLGFEAERRHLLDKDRAARILLGFYNTAVLAFEQVDECIDGGFVGDRDGKFRFFVGRGREYAPPGFEDAITGVLNPRNVWARVFAAEDTSRVITFDPKRDQLVEPEDATMVAHTLIGPPLNSHRLDRLILRQRAFVQNDVDDQVLIGTLDGGIRFIGTFPFFVPVTLGQYALMGTPHRYSRIFPETARVFFTLQPGVGADIEGSGNPGAYTAGRTNAATGEVESTTGKPIGQVGNPVLGPLSNISEKILRQRLARARIFGYYPDGVPTFGVNDPCLVVSAVPLRDLPIDPATGFPDTTQLLSQPPGTLPDGEAGDPAMALPGFVAGDQIAWGKPDGTLYAAYFDEGEDVFGTTVLTGVFVDQVVSGCVLTFKDRNGNVITDPAKLFVGTAPDAGTPAHMFPIEQGDTVYVIPTTGTDTPVAAVTDPVRVEMLQQAAALTPAFRTGFDLAVRQDGRVIDTSLPSWDDPYPFGLRELLGQKPPKPMSHVEGQVDFAEARQLPLNIPALLGQDKDDSGDFQIPYMRATATELDRFDEIALAFGPVMETDPITGAVYPDEILFNDGEVLGAAVLIAPGFYREPSTVMTQANVLPVPDIGTEPARSWDFLLFEVTQGAPLGWQGISSIGAVRSAMGWSWIEPPRFVTQTGQGDAIQYILTNYAVHTTPGNYPPNPQVTNPPGVRLTDDIAGAKTILSFQDVVLALNDGNAIFTGNLNTIWAAGLNEIRVKVIARPDTDVVNYPGGGPPPVDGTVLLTIFIRQNDAEVLDYLGNTYGPFLYGAVGPSGNAVEFGTFDPVTGEPPPPAGAANRRHIVLYGMTGLIPFGPGPGTPSEWFLPHDHFDPGGPNEKKVSKYGWEFAIDIDAHQVGAGQSTSAWIDDDRLTFHEVVDFRSSRPRGFAHPLNGAALYETALRVRMVTTGLGMLPVNDVIGGDLTFLSRTGSSTSIEGTWTPAPSPAEDGTVRVMAFEWGNSPVVLSNVTASAMASNSDQPGGPILEGTGTAVENRIGMVFPLAGTVANVQQGDVVVIDRGVASVGVEKAGTYIARYVMDAPPGIDFVKVSMSVEYGDDFHPGFVTTRSPKVVAFDSGANTLEIESGGTIAPGGRVFVFLDVAQLGSAVPADFREAAFSASFVALVGDTLTGLADYRWADNALMLPGEIAALGTLAGMRTSFITAGGEAQLVVSVRGGPVPDDGSVVGHQAPLGLPAPGGDVAFFGVQYITLESPLGAFDVVWQAGAPAPAPEDGEVVDGAVAPAVSEVGVLMAVPVNNGVSQPDRDAVVYDNVPSRFRFRLSDLQGQTLNDPNSLAPVGAFIHMCIVPGTVISLEDVPGGNPGFLVKAGVFVEPSTPQQPISLDPLGAPHVVADGYNLPLADVGMRNLATPETVHFEVRRVRRWHGVQNPLNDVFRPLRFVYEIRRGIVTAFSKDPQQFGLVTAAAFQMAWNNLNPGTPRAPDVWNENNGKLYDGTNLGAFDDRDVNIHPGDMFRVLDDDGKLLGEAEIVQVVGPTQLRLAPPGLAPLLTADVTGRRFEVWLRRAPVPHEQSNEQLLDLLVDKTLHETVADYTDPDPQNWTGGYVPSTDGSQGWSAVSNKLYDDQELTGIGNDTFIAKGVQKDDIVLIDPAGTLPNGERGQRPLGDLGAPGRTAIGQPSPYQPFPASSLDDNRGFYRVTKVEADHIEVSGASIFSGDFGDDRIFAEARTDLLYVVYPTVNVSPLSTDNAEGQTDLRPTLKAENNSFTGYMGDAVKDAHSIRPFSFRIVRQTNMLSREVADTILFIRERMLSLIELFRSPMRGLKGGFYWDFQDETHIHDLGVANDPDSGLGLFSNRLIQALCGEMGVSPYLNNSACLSLLDRRFWVLDRRLDSLRPDGAFAMQMAAGGPAFPNPDGPYTAYTDITVGGSEVRPVLPDHLGLVLDVRDRLRDIRYVWLAYRTHRLIGTLARIRQFDADLPGRLDERKRALLMETTAGEVES